MQGFALIAFGLLLFPQGILTNLVRVQVDFFCSNLQENIIENPRGHVLGMFCFSIGLNPYVTGLPEEQIYSSGFFLNENRSTILLFIFSPRRIQIEPLNTRQHDFDWLEYIYLFNSFDVIYTMPVSIWVRGNRKPAFIGHELAIDYIL